VAIEVEIKGVRLSLETAPGLFSPRKADAGTLAMLSRVDFAPGQRVLDLGCGYGVVGLVAAKLAGAGGVFLVDTDPQAVAVARRNAAANGLEGLCIERSDGFNQFRETGFDLILCNPPYQADFAVPKHFIEKGFNRLKLGGRLFMVTKRELWYRNKLTAIFGRVTVRHVDGYSVFEAIRRSQSYANKMV